MFSREDRKRENPMTNSINDFDLLTIEDINALTGIEQIDYDDYFEAFSNEDITERDEFFTILAENIDLPF